MYEVGAGYVAKQRWQQSQGVQFDIDTISIEQIRDKWADVNQYERGATNPTSNQDLMAIVMNNLEKKQQAKAAAAAAKPAAGGAAAAGGSGLKSDSIFAMMTAYLEGGHGAPLIPKVSAVFGFNILKKKGAKPSLVYTIDMKNGQGKCYPGKADKTDATFTVTDDDFEKICLGKLQPQIAFMQGKMKIGGNMSKASKFTPDLFPPPTEENKAKFMKL